MMSGLLKGRLDGAYNSTIDTICIRSLNLWWIWNEDIKRGHPDSCVALLSYLQEKVTTQTFLSKGRISFVENNAYYFSGLEIENCNFSMWIFPWTFLQSEHKIRKWTQSIERALYTKNFHKLNQGIMIMYSSLYFSSVGTYQSFNIFLLFKYC